MLLECQKLVRTDIGTWQRVVYGGDGGEVGAGSEGGRSRGPGAAARRWGFSNTCGGVSGGLVIV